ncbi:hypothetical protein JOC34_002881 [Virgibacillus halotolerans]|nr:hypothetical protein [Virgibacillus halotolerans]
MAEAILQLRRECVGNYRIINRVQCAAETGPALTLKAWAFYSSSKGTPDKLMQALVNGYEVERTPHDQLREYYESNSAWVEDPGSYVPTERQRFIGRNQGVLKTLKILGITVEGVNDLFPKEAPL